MNSKKESNKSFGGIPSTHLKKGDLVKYYSSVSDRWCWGIILEDESAHVKAYCFTRSKIFYLNGRVPGHDGKKVYVFNSGTTAHVEKVL